MLQLPSPSKQYAVPNNSDLFGNLWYTKNINLDEEGYIKLSPRAVSIQNQAATSNLRLAVAFGRKNDDGYVVPATEFAMTQSGTKGYWITLSEAQLVFNPDIGTGAPTFTEDSHGRWFHNLWHVTDTGDLWSKATLDDAATYTEITDGTPANLTSAKVHAIEVFRNKDALCVTNGNTVNLYNGTTYAIDFTLTIPADYEAVGLSYNNSKMGVIAMLSDTASGQNQDALFFDWAGDSSSAGQGVSIGSDKSIAIAPYKGTWVILTRAGQLIQWTGGGFSVLASFPFYYQQLIWGQSYSRDLLGDVMQVDGDVIHINMNGVLNASGKRYETYLQNNPGGIWCYDPKIGLYPRHSPSISPVNVLTVTSGNINTTTNILTKTAGTIPSTGSPIKYVFDRASLIGGLTTPTVYYCIKVSSTEFKLATTKDLAIAGTAIDITSTGAANNYFLALEVYDYGASITTKSGAIGLFDVNSETYRDMIFGAELNDFDGTGDSNHVNVLCSGFESRGYFVTPKIVSSAAQDVLQKLLTSYRPLKTGDKIIYKYKDQELEGLPVSSCQARTTALNRCSWTGADAFSTTMDLADAKTAFDAGHELECEVIAGAGAGTLTKIDDISYSAGTYSVQLEEDVDGAAASRYCDVIIDNWRVITTITSSSRTEKNLFQHGDIGAKSAWFKIKGELRGTDVAIFDQKFISAVHQNTA